MNHRLHRLEEVRPDERAIRKWRRELHRRPELSGQELATADYIAAELGRQGLNPTRPLPNAVVAEVCGQAGSSDRAIALRADIDALPGTEITDLPFASQNPGAMHACGHDAHAAMLLGAAGWLNHHRESFSGRIRFIFQPGEEQGLGARELVAAGILEGIGNCFALHVASDLPCGTVAVVPGTVNAAVDGFTVQLTGRPAHVGHPELGADALVAGAQMVTALQALRPRLINPLEPAIIGIGVFRAGETYNQVAGTATIAGTTRTAAAATRERLRTVISDLVSATAGAFGVQAEITWRDICPPVVNDPEAAARVQRVIRHELPAIALVSARDFSLGGDNFADFLHQVPGVYAYLGVRDPAVPGSGLSLHHPAFTPAEAALPLGSALHIRVALDYLQEEA